MQETVSCFPESEAIAPSASEWCNLFISSSQISKRSALTQKLWSFPASGLKDLNASTLSFPLNSFLGPSAYPSQGIIPLSLGFRSSSHLLSLAKRLMSLVPEPFIVFLMGSRVKDCPWKRGLKPRLREDQINPVPGQSWRTKGASDQRKGDRVHFLMSRLELLAVSLTLTVRSQNKSRKSRTSSPGSRQECLVICPVTPRDPGGRQQAGPGAPH